MIFSTVFIGVSAPQGCGKTTLTEYLQVNIYMCFLATKLVVLTWLIYAKRNEQYA